MKEMRYIHGENNIMTCSIKGSIQSNTRAILMQSFKIASEIALLGLHWKVLSCALLHLHIHVHISKTNQYISLMSRAAEAVVNKFTLSTVFYSIKTHGRLLNFTFKNGHLFEVDCKLPLFESERFC